MRQREIDKLLKEYGEEAFYAVVKNASEYAFFNEARVEGDEVAVNFSTIITTICALSAALAKAKFDENIYKDILNHKDLTTIRSNNKGLIDIIMVANENMGNINPDSNSFYDELREIFRTVFEDTVVYILKREK